MRTAAALLFLSSALVQGAVLADEAPRRWISSWGTALEIAPPPGMKVPPPPEPARAQVRAYPPPVIPYPKSLNDQTVRMTLKASAGGSALRVQLSNAQGRQPLVVGAAHVAARAEGAATDGSTDHLLTFAGRKSVTIPPGAIIASDPVSMALRSGQELAVSLYLPQDTGGVTVHGVGLNPSYIAPGDQSGDATLTGLKAYNSYFWLAGVDVLADSPGVIDAFGDSIADGFATTPGTHRTWPEVLAERLRAKGVNWGVINMGISGNRIRRDGAGASALARFDRDVLSRPGVKWIVMLEGINDISLTVIPGIAQQERASAQEIIAAYALFVDKAHMHGMKVMGGTLTPTGGLWLYSPQSEQMRQDINRWIRTSGTFDAVVDFDKAIADPVQPSRIRPDFDSGDHVHPNDAGTAAMAMAIDLSRF